MHAKPVRLLQRVREQSTYFSFFLYLTLGKAMAQDWADPMVGLAESGLAGVESILKPVAILGLIIYGGVCAVLRRFIIGEAAVIVAGAGVVWFGADMMRAAMSS